MAHLHPPSASAWVDAHHCVRVHSGISKDLTRHTLSGTSPSYARGPEPPASQLSFSPRSYWTQSRPLEGQLAFSPLGAALSSTASRSSPGPPRRLPEGAANTKMSRLRGWSGRRI